MSDTYSNMTVSASGKSNSPGYNENIDEERYFDNATKSTDCDCYTPKLQKGRRDSCTSSSFPSSESTPLIASETKIRYQTDSNTNDTSSNDDEYEYERQQCEDSKNDPMIYTAHREDSYSDDDSFVRNGASSLVGKCDRYHRPLMPIIVAVIVFFASAVAMMGVVSHRYGYYIASSLSGGPFPSSNPDDRISPSKTENAANIEALKESLSSSLEDLPNAAVASDHPVCSRVGTDILQYKGGNAVDAAVATILCLGVASPASSGLGGGSFLLIRSSRSHFEERRNQQRGNNSTMFPVFDDARDHTDDTNNPDDDLFVTEAIDCREAAPEKSSSDMYTGLPEYSSLVGGLAVPVPGELRGLELAHARHGKLPWSDVVEPSMLLARDGVAVDRHMARFIKIFFTFWVPKLGGDGTNSFISGLVTYLSSSRKKENNNVEYLREGELLLNPPLAQTLQEIAENGADAFYTGRIAESLVKEVREAGGILTMNDLQSYKAILRTPVSADVYGYTLLGVPPPSSGGAVVLAILRFLSGYSTPFKHDTEGLSMHRMVEGMRHAFSIRMSLSDPAFNTNLNKDAVHDLTTSGYMESLRKMTRDDTVLSLSDYGGQKWGQLHDEDFAKEAQDAHEGDRRQRKRRLVREQGSSNKSNVLGNTQGTGIKNNENSDSSNQNRRRRLARPFGYLEDSGTSHLSVVDSDGNAVAITSSINNIFGSLIYSKTTGVLLGNTMDDFGVPLQKSNAYGILPSEANFIVPGKRPLSSMSPTIVLRNKGVGGGRPSPGKSNKWGDLVMVWGGSGGPKIISAVVLVFLNVVFRGMSLFDAITSPRVHDQLLYHDSIVTAVEKSMLEGVGTGDQEMVGPALEVSENIKRALLQRDHKLLDIDYTGCVQAILVNHDTNTLSAVSDMRKDGSPSGY